MTKEVAIALLKAREASGLSQRDVSYLAGVAPSALSAVESGKQNPSVALAVALTVIHGTPFETLFFDLRNEVKAEIATRLQEFSAQMGQVEMGTLRAASLVGLRSRLDRLDDTWEYAS